MPTKKWDKSVCHMTMGTSHARVNTPCQDYVAICDHARYTIAALADGVGSLRYSETAAKEAVNGTIQWFMENEEWLGGSERSDDGFNLIRSKLPAVLRQRIRNAASEQELDVTSMDCNLAFVYIRKYHDAQDRIYVGVLGDCAVLCIGEGDDMRTLCGASSGLATDSVMSPDFAQRINLTHFWADTHKKCGFILTSDGLADEIYEKNSKYVNQAAQEYYNAVFSPNPQAKVFELFQTLQQRPYFSDDMSIAVISRDTAPRTFPEDTYWTCCCGQKNPMATTRCLNCDMDYYRLYADLPDEIKAGGFADATEYFRQLNKDPEKARNRAGIAPQIPAAKKTSENKKTEHSVTDVPTSDGLYRIKAKSSEQPKKQDKKPKNQQNTDLHSKQTHGQQHDKQTSENEEVDNQNRNQHPVKPRRQWNAAVVTMCAVVLLLQLVMTAVSIVNLISTQQGQKIDKLISHQIQILEDKLLEADSIQEGETTPGDTPEQYYLDMGNGWVYYGMVRDGQPHGYGTLCGTDEILSGEFSYGQKNGMFMVRSGLELSIVEYRYDKQIGEAIRIPAESASNGNMTAYHMTSQDVETYESPDVYGNQDPMVIPAGTSIWLTGNYVYVPDNWREPSELWLEIYMADETTGWCRAAELGMTPA